MNFIDAKKDWFPNIHRCVCDEAIPSFDLKKDAIAAAKQYGWKNDVIRVHHRYYSVWIVGKVSFQPDEVAGVIFDVLRVPLLRYENDDRGIKYQPVVSFRLVREKKCV